VLNDQDPRNGRSAKQYLETVTPVIMTVYTRAPQKWLLVDRETGEVYQGSEHGDWDKLKPIIDVNKKKEVPDGDRPE